MVLRNVDRGPILAIGDACGAPVKRALDQLLDVFERQAEREVRERVAKELRAVANPATERGAGVRWAADFILQEGKADG